MNATLRNIFWVMLMLLGFAPAVAQEGDWPRTVTLDDGGTVTIYEPQVEEMDESFVRFRAALAYREAEGQEPVFGAGWFESALHVDRFSRTAHPVGMKVTQTRFPIEAEVQQRLGETMAKPGFAANFSFSLDEFEASRKAAEAEAIAAENLRTAPPKIIYRDRPALLVTIDGEPVLREIEDSPYEAVINTPFPMIHDGRDYYVNVAKGAWYRSGNATGPYRFVQDPPAAIAQLVQPEDEVEAPEDSAPGVNITADNAPEIVVSTEPAELVVTEGPAAFVPLVDELLVLDNSEDDVFMHTGEQRYYIVLSGRWYRSRSLDGPWEFRESSDLPAAFARIPDDSKQSDSRVFVAGTEEAEQAVLDAQVPQTAAVARGKADVDVEYDGEPVFEEVEGTDMVYAANSGSTVLYADGLYYLVEDGVWYVSTQPEGPWQVAVARPDQVRVILPSSPVYPVKYVYIYDYTPDVVYVGYTPGYLGSYVYGPTVVYGSGWYYRPWVSYRHYYPRRSTWGFHVNYDPWYGWNFGLSWGWGPFNLTYWTGGYWHHSHYWHHRHYGYWGPHGYRPRHHRHRPPHHRPPGHGAGHRPHPYERHRNLYADSRQQAPVRRTLDRPPAVLDRSSKVPVVAKTPASKGKSFAANKRADAAYAGSAAVSRSDLTRKAKTTDRELARSKAKFQAADRKEPGPGSRAAPGVSRKELQQKAKVPLKAEPPEKQFSKNSAKIQPVKQNVSRKDLELKAKESRKAVYSESGAKAVREKEWAANRARAKGERAVPGASRSYPSTRPGPGGAAAKAPLPKQVTSRSQVKTDGTQFSRKAVPNRKAVAPREPITRKAAPVKRLPQRSVANSLSSSRSTAALPRVRLTNGARSGNAASRPVSTAPKAFAQPQVRSSQGAPPKRQSASGPPRQKAAAPSRNKSYPGKERQKIR